MRTLFRLCACAALARTGRCAATRGTRCGSASSSPDNASGSTHAWRRASPLRATRFRHTRV
ncbi:hypothetical protein A8F72_31115 [Burkholderia cenocepacia]|nr:hypothetical protein TQ36_26780 [Burkholderia cenocepacia]AQQ46574.1 hypothetical protein A8F32_12175 [Burkholderia cenocepacia]ONI96909.1 hypothetical protein A8F33_32295 [Burkholderia cenocepacia]ONJ01436.1 hypothetical protein A8F53_15530 [Burkholderia cenocepacia]ONJ33759.1 hypothetical protein A8F38_06460 [Burkholderia cenocepacia]